MYVCLGMKLFVGGELSDQIRRTFGDRMGVYLLTEPCVKMKSRRCEAECWTIWVAECWTILEEAVSDTNPLADTVGMTTWTPGRGRQTRGEPQRRVANR